MNRGYMGLLVSIVLVIVTHVSFKLCDEDRCKAVAPASTLHAQVMNFLGGYLFCADCLFAPQSRIVWWLWTSGKIAYSSAMLLVLEVQSHVHKWTIMGIILDALRDSYVISYFPYIVLKVLLCCVYMAYISCTLIEGMNFCAKLSRAALNTALPVVQRGRRNWQMIARIVIVVVLFYCYAAFLRYNWPLPGNAVHQQDLTVSKDSGITKAMKVAVGTGVTTAVGYGLLWLVTQE
jgi:hypothetical protein